MTAKSRVVVKRQSSGDVSTFERSGLSARAMVIAVTGAASLF
jgi:hypothetical protein